MWKNHSKLWKTDNPFMNFCKCKECKKVCYNYYL